MQRSGGGQHGCHHRWILRLADVFARACGMAVDADGQLAWE
jgi:hypothetical protein